MNLVFNTGKHCGIRKPECEYNTPQCTEKDLQLP